MGTFKSRAATGNCFLFWALVLLCVSLPGSPAVEVKKTTTINVSLTLGKVTEVVQVTSIVGVANMTRCDRCVAHPT